MRPYYEQAGVTIYHGDALEMGLVADAIVTDPPYGVGIDYGGGVLPALREPALLQRNG